MTLGLLPQFNNTSALRYFYEVARYGSFRLAADRINIAASAISRQIQLLEQELGVLLFERDRKGLRLTAAGEALLHRTRGAMAELSGALSDIADLQGTQRGTVRVGLNETVAREFATGLLMEFRAAHPLVNIDIMVANTSELVPALLDGALDVFVGYGNPVRDGVEQVAGFALETCITVRSDHRLAQYPSVRVADLVDERFVMPDASSSLRQTLNAVFARASVRPSAVMTTSSFELMNSLVAEGMGIGCQVRVVPGPDPVRSQIVYVPIRDRQIRPALLACCVRTGASRTAAAGAFIRLLRDRLTQGAGEDAAVAIAS
jgi:DNA-binding transcriptional LysR family regulator